VSEAGKPVSYPWRLRLVHEGYSSIRLERPGSWFRFDPRDPPEEGEQVVLTWAELGRAEGTLQAVRMGTNPRVVAVPALRGWLHEHGSVQDRSPGGRVDDVQIEAIEYEPIPFATGAEAARKTKAALMSPAVAARRLLRRTRTPTAPPIVVQLSFADGSRLLHLNCSLHQRATQGWLNRCVERFRGADWVIAGVDYEEEEAFERLVPSFEPGKLLVTDLVGNTRADLGLPVRHVTPLVDRLCAQGLAAFPFVGGTTYRFE